MSGASLGADVAGAGATGASSGTGGANGLAPWAVDAIYYAACLAIMPVVVLVNSTSRVSERHTLGLDLPVWESVLWEATSAAAVFLILPAVTALARRIPWDHRPLWRSMLAHLLATIPFSLVHMMLMFGFRGIVYQAIARPYDALHVLRTEALYEYRKDVITYLFLVCVYWGWRRIVSLPKVVTVEVPIAAPSASALTFEVRDGARRVFVRIDEIAWIEAAGNYAEMHLISGARHLHRSALSALETALAPQGLVRIHRSRLVARGQIAEIIPAQAGDFTVRLRSGEILAGSRRFRQGLFAPVAPAPA